MDLWRRYWPWLAAALGVAALAGLVLWGSQELGLAAGAASTLLGARLLAQRGRTAGVRGEIESAQDTLAQAQETITDTAWRDEVDAVEEPVGSLSADEKVALGEDLLGDP